MNKMTFLKLSLVLLCVPADLMCPPKKKPAVVVPALTDGSVVGDEGDGTVLMAAEDPKSTAMVVYDPSIAYGQDGSSDTSGVSSSTYVQQFQATMQGIARYLQDLQKSITDCTNALGTAQQGASDALDASKQTIDALSDDVQRASTGLTVAKAVDDAS